MNRFIRIFGAAAVTLSLWSAPTADAAAGRTVVLADSSKFGRRGFSRICGLGDIDHVITDSGTPPKMLEAMREQGIKVTVVPADEA